MTEPLRVYVVDDHPVVSAGVARLVAAEPDMRVIGTADAAARALCDLREMSADVVLVDYRLEKMNGAQLCGVLTAEPYALRCVALTGEATSQVAREFLVAGAQGIVFKDSGTDTIISAIRTVGRGGRFVDPAAATLVLEASRPPSSDVAQELTPRELQILRLIAEGYSNREIGVALCVSTGSAKSYLSALLRKLGVGGRAEAVAVAAREGWLAPP